MTPDSLRYTAEHEWIGPAGAGPLRVGLTDFAQRQLGDIVFVELPQVGAAVSAGEALGSVESVKSVSEVYAPVSGTVVARNEQLTDQPELINEDPYGEGWLVEIGSVAPAELDGLLDAAGYQEVIASAG